MLIRRIVMAGVVLLAASACNVFDGQRASPTPSPVVTRLTPTAQPASPLAPEATATFAPAPPTEPPAPSPTGIPPGAIMGEHVVQRGESLFCIGRGYGVVPSAIAAANGRPATSGLLEGELLKIPAVQWANIPPGPVCAPQFASPFSVVSTATAAPPTGQGEETILILGPGPGSSVTSPVHVAGEADPTFEQSLVVQISDEAGAVIAILPAQINADLGQRGPFGVEVPFQVNADQPGRITVFAASARDGGLTHLASLEVTLRASGAAALNPGMPHEETIAIYAPAFLATVSGGTAHVTGFSDYVFESQVAVAICGEGGSGTPDPICGTEDNVLGRGVAFVASPDVGLPGPFTADVSYTVAAPVRGRIAVYDISPRDGGLRHLASQEVTLTP